MNRHWVKLACGCLAVLIISETTGEILAKECDHHPYCETVQHTDPETTQLNLSAAQSTFTSTGLS